MDSEQFHDAAVEYIRKAVMASLAFESNGLTWEVAGEPLMELLCRMIEEAETPFSFSVHSWRRKGEADEARVYVDVDLFTDDVNDEHTYTSKETNLSDLLLERFPFYEAEYVLDNIAAIERSCVIARAKLAARMDEDVR
jgi:hypothetical protein